MFGSYYYDGNYIDENITQFSTSAQQTQTTPQNIFNILYRPRRSTSKRSVFSANFKYVYKYAIDVSFSQDVINSFGRGARIVGLEYQPSTNLYLQKLRTSIPLANELNPFNYRFPFSDSKIGSILRSGTRRITRYSDLNDTGRNSFSGNKVYKIYS